MARFILIGVLAATLISLPAQAQMLFFFVGSSGGGTPSSCSGVIDLSAGCTLGLMP